MTLDDLEPNDWKRLESLLEEAFELPRGDRDAFLVEMAADEPRLAALLRELLEADDVAGGMLAQVFGKARR
jgi:hypothetical protein